MILNKKTGKSVLNYNSNSQPFATIVKLSSTHAINIYEYLKALDINGVDKTIITLDKMKEILNINKDSSMKYTYLKNYIIKKVQSELYSKAEISFEYEEIKNGNKVAEIFFKIKKLSNQTVNKPNY